VRWLSARSGIELGTLERVLTGERDVTVIELADIARALGVPVARLTP
jgi:transcriptional regulator with XRE-family HTH domain